jgi:tRNA (guanine-N7-)-methyltransferase
MIRVLCQLTDFNGLSPAIPDDPAVASEAEAAPLHRRGVKSFVARAGRMTTAQERAWRELWPRYGIEDPGGVLDLGTLFGRDAPRTLEIGFGNGESLLALAAARPAEDFLGVEVHRPGVGHLMLRAEATGLGNVRIACRDAVEVLEQRLGDATLDAVLLYFPDPWPKKRHHKRRIVQPPFVELVARKLKPGGRFRLATDWQNYAEQMLAVVGACGRLENEFGAGYAPRPGDRPLTRFENRGHRLGHQVWDLSFTKR